ncbi:polysaccharide deacetylase family protein [Roseibium sp.]|uniref:polysaccharide deacetylase family protein n=1 Tax=Roseibium sp. TaxID=1936156 RepID=UPI003BACA4E7
MQNSKLRIINFHGIGTPKRPLEEGEEHYWISEQQYSAFLDLVAPVRDRVLITFDDGNLSDLETGAKGLQERALTATFFPLAGRLNEPGALGKDQLQELLSLGHKIGSHGYDHVSWKHLDEGQARKELWDAKALLEDSIGQQISEAAIPFGMYGKRTLRQLRSAGYERVYSSDGGSFQGCPFPIPRWSVRADTTELQVADFLDGQEPAASRVRRYLGKLKKQII